MMSYNQASPFISSAYPQMEQPALLPYTYMMPNVALGYGAMYPHNVQYPYSYSPGVPMSALVFNTQPQSQTFLKDSSSFINDMKNPLQLQSPLSGAAFGYPFVGSQATPNRHSQAPNPLENLTPMLSSLAIPLSSLWPPTIYGRQHQAKTMESAVDPESASSSLSSLDPTAYQPSVSVSSYSSSQPSESGSYSSASRSSSPYSQLGRDEADQTYADAVSPVSSLSSCSSSEYEVDTDHTANQLQVAGLAPFICECLDSSSDTHSESLVPVEIHKVASPSEDTTLSSSLIPSSDCEAGRRNWVDTQRLRQPPRLQSLDTISSASLSSSIESCSSCEDFGNVDMAPAKRSPYMAKPQIAEDDVCVVHAVTKSIPKRLNASAVSAQDHKSKVAIYDSAIHDGNSGFGRKYSDNPHRGSSISAKDTESQRRKNSTSAKDKESQRRKNSTSAKDIESQRRKNSISAKDVSQHREKSTSAKDMESQHRKNSTSAKDIESQLRKNSTSAKDVSQHRKNSTSAKDMESQHRKNSTSAKDIESQRRKNSTSAKDTESQRRKNSTSAKDKEGQCRKNSTSAKDIEKPRGISNSSAKDVESQRRKSSISAKYQKQQVQRNISILEEWSTQSSKETPLEESSTQSSKETPLDEDFSVAEADSPSCFPTRKTKLKKADKKRK